jgi:hypothetical protein
MTAGWGARTVRAAMFAAVCVLLAALGHVLMSGRSVPWWALLAGAALTAAAGWCLAGRERGLRTVVTAVVVAQTALHTAFTLAQMPGSGTTASLPAHAMHTPHPHGASAHTGMGMGMDMGAGPAPHALVPLPDAATFGMFAAHLVAALLCGLWLAYGERAAFRLLRAMAARLAAPLRLLRALPAPPDRPRVRPRRRRSGRAPRPDPLVHTITTRGPPAGTAVA